MKPLQKPKPIWKEVELKNFVEISSGKREKGGALKEGSVASLGGQHVGINGKIIWKGMKFIGEEFFENLIKGKVKINDILVVKDGATTGKVAFVDKLEYEKVAVNEHVFILRTKEIYSKYLFYFLYSQKGQSELRIGFHGMIGGIGPKDIQKIKIPLPFSNGKPDLATQKQIVAVLEKAERLKQKQKRTLELYDEYTKSVFWEMFGDPNSPKNKFEKKPFLDSIEKEASNNNLKIQGKDFLEEGKYPIVDQGEEFIAGYTNDSSKVYDEKLPVIVFGDHTRILKYVDFPFALGADGVKILIPKEEFNPIYFYYCLKLLNIKSAGYSRHYKFLKEKKIPLPPIELQQKFASIVEKVEKLKEKQKKSLADAEELFNALMQKAFRGELE